MTTKGYLLDTSVVSRLALAKSANASPDITNVLSRVKEVREGVLLICSITVGEIEYGLNAAPSPSTEAQAEMRRIVQSFPIVIDIDKHVGACYGDLRGKLFHKFAPRNKKGRARTKYVEEWLDPTTGKVLGVTENDVWIAALALEHEQSVVSRDDHFDSVRGVTRLGW